MKYDIFICYASEDKLKVATPLANELGILGLKVWLDEFELTVGDSLRRSIDKGLLDSKFGVVILSTYFFKKEWPQKELDALIGKESRGKKVVLPVWHNITEEEVRIFSPTLADKIAISTERGIKYVADQIYKAIRKDANVNHMEQSENCFDWFCVGHYCVQLWNQILYKDMRVTYSVDELAKLAGKLKFDNRFIINTLNKGEMGIVSDYIKSIATSAQKRNAFNLGASWESLNKALGYVKNPDILIRVFTQTIGSLQKLSLNKTSQAITAWFRPIKALEKGYPEQQEEVEQYREKLDTILKDTLIQELISKA